MNPAWAMALTLLLAGCAAPMPGDATKVGSVDAPDDDPPPAVPLPAPDDLWMAYSTGCGMCSGSPDYPEFFGLGLYGGVLVRFDYARGYDDEGAVQFGDDLSAQARDLSQRFFADHAAYAQETPYREGDDPVRVLTVRARAVDVDDEVRSMLEATDEPRDQPCDAEDGGGEHYTVLDDEGAHHTHLYCTHVDEGWDDLGRYFRGLNRATFPEDP